MRTNKQYSLTQKKTKKKPQSNKQTHTQNPEKKGKLSLCDNHSLDKSPIHLNAKAHESARRVKCETVKSLLQTSICFQYKAQLIGKITGRIRRMPYNSSLFAARQFFITAVDYIKNSFIKLLLSVKRLHMRWESRPRKHLSCNRNLSKVIHKPAFFSPTT